MNKNTHKTVRVHATMHTDLYADINVPINTDKHEIWQFITDGNIDGADMSEDEGTCSGAWTWEEPNYENEFNPDAINVSKEILKP